MKLQIKYYKPFKKWFGRLDLKTQAITARYIHRLSLSSTSKNIKPLKDGVFEIKINYGPGLRVYFAYEDKTLVLLLLGGNKSSQSADIKRAKQYWRDYVQKK